MPRPRSSRDRSCLALFLTFCLLLGRPSPARADDDTRLYEVFVNGRATQLQAEFIQQGERLSATAEDLHALGLRTAGLRPDAAGRIALDAIPGLTWQVDEHSQEIRIAAPDAALVANQVAASSAPRAPALQSNYGAVVNYDVLATQVDGRTSASSLLDSRLTMPWGVADAGWLAQTGLPTRSLTRLDTGLTYVDPDTLRRCQAGDLVTSGLTWTRPFRMGGLQLASDFSPRPDLVTFPVPQISGHADLPSTVDVFVNSVRQLSQSVDPGPFQVRQAPVVTGDGDVAVVVRDVTGREQVQKLDFYASPTLLNPGLASYSVEAGWVRQDYALAGDRYTQPALSGSVRYGLAEWITAEGHTEASGQVVMAGGGGTVNLWNLGTGTLALAASNPTQVPSPGARRAAIVGGLVSAGVEHTSRLFSIAISTTRATHAFQDVVADRQNRVPGAVNRASLGFPVWGGGAMRLSYAGISGRTSLSDPALGSYALPTAGDAQIVAASYSRPITESVQFYANTYRDFTAAHGGTGVVFGVTMLLGGRSAATAETGLTAGRLSGSVEASQAATLPGQIGWRAQLSRDPDDRQNGQVSYVTPFATASAELDRVGGSTGLRAEATGALVATPYGTFASNRIDDSYAVVDTGGVGNVGVLQENRPVGRTDSDGLLLIPNLRGWQSNRIALDPVDLPADVTAGQTSQVVRLPSHAGGHVSFDTRRGGSAVIRLVDPAGQAIPAGSVATLRDGSRTPVGHDGELFLTDLLPRNSLRVRTTRGECQADFPFAPRADTLPVIGPVTCSSQENPR